MKLSHFINCTACDPKYSPVSQDIKSTDKLFFQFLWGKEKKSQASRKTIINEKLFISQFKQTIIDCYKQEWNTLINNSNKLSDYRTYKITFEFEKYLDVLNI